MILNLIVANLLMYSLPDMILVYLATPFLHRRCFCMRLYYVHTVTYFTTVIQLQLRTLAKLILLYITHNYPHL